MDFASIAQLRSLPLPYLLLVCLLGACAVAGLAILGYVGIRAAFDVSSERKVKRGQRETWFAEQARIHRERK